MENQKKILTRVQLINWHYFENERIAFHGSTLISGENTAGKSTILDAIQLVLTTNTRRFNAAANEKGNRNLKGYVRCKIGNVGETYFRKNAVPANVALEFYEEKDDRYFVIGVHMLSPDEESTVATRWYVEECRLEALSFTVGQRPALAEEFRANGRKIQFIDQKHIARERFKRRLGNLDDKFFDIIPKSLAFKPMDNVKEFINKFVLSEKQIDVAVLRENIETLSELEAVLERSKQQLTALKEIIDKQESIEAKDYLIRVNEILLQLADCSALQEEQEQLIKQIRLKKQSVQSNNEALDLLETKIRNVDEQILAVSVDMESNSSNRQREKAKKQIEDLNASIKEKSKEKKRLEEQLQCLKEYLRDVTHLGYEPISRQQWEMLGGIGKQEEKSTVVEELEEFEQKEQKELELKWARHADELRQLSDAIDDCQERLRGLNKQILPYPEYAEKLKKSIEKEFAKRGIHTNVYFLSELLEITDMRWSDAIEGYLHTQKFYLVVEPEYYDIALSVYEKNRRKIHTAGIINSKRLPLDGEIEHQSLACVIKSENRYARAYANYILGRVMRCDTVEELGNYAISITPECMLYQGYVVRHINPRYYENPFIGQNAYRVQIQNVKKEIEEKTGQRSELREKLKQYSNARESAGRVKLELIKLYLNVPDILHDMQQQLTKAKAELKAASNDPTLIELEIRLEEMRREKMN